MEESLRWSNEKLVLSGVVRSQRAATYIACSPVPEVPGVLKSRLCTLIKRSLRAENTMLEEGLRFLELWGLLSWSLVLLDEFRTSQVRETAVTEEFTASSC